MFGDGGSAAPRHDFLKRFPANIRWRVVLVSAAALAIGLAHAPLLRLLTWPLRSEQSSEDAGYLVLLGTERGVHGNHGLAAAARFYRADTRRRILLIECRPGRLAELGILLPFAALGRQELIRRGVPDTAIETMPGQAADAWDAARELAAWLHARPGVLVAYASLPLSGGHLRWILDRTMAPGDAARIRIFAPEDPARASGNWWTSRSGVKAFMFAWIERAYAWCQGEQPPPPPQQSAAAYQAMLRKAFEKSP